MSKCTLLALTRPWHTHSPHTPPPPTHPPAHPRGRTAPPNADDVPPGTYTGSCRGCTIALNPETFKDELHCECHSPHSPQAHSRNTHAAHDEASACGTAEQVVGLGHHMPRHTHMRTCASPACEVHSAHTLHVLHTCSPTHACTRATHAAHDTHVPSHTNTHTHTHVKARSAQRRMGESSSRRSNGRRAGSVTSRIATGSSRALIPQSPNERGRLM